MHVHFHIIPKEPGGNGLGVGWQGISFDHESGAKLAESIASELAS